MNTRWLMGMFRTIARLPGRRRWRVRFEPDGWYVLRPDGMIDQEGGGAMGAHEWGPQLDAAEDRVVGLNLQLDELDARTPLSKTELRDALHVLVLLLMAAALCGGAYLFFIY